MVRTLEDRSPSPRPWCARPRSCSATPSCAPPSTASWPASSSMPATSPPRHPLLELEGTAAFQVEAAVPDSLAANLAPGAALDRRNARHRADLPGRAGRDFPPPPTPAPAACWPNSTVPAGTAVRSGQFVRVSRCPAPRPAPSSFRPPPLRSARWSASSSPVRAPRRPPPGEIRRQSRRPRRNPLRPRRRRARRRQPARRPARRPNPGDPPVSDLPPFPDPAPPASPAASASMFIASKLTPIAIIASMLLGLFSVLMLPREEEPQIKVPMIDVFVGMPGASAAEVENRVTRPMEKLLWEIPGVEYLYSTSSPGGALSSSASRSAPTSRPPSSASTRSCRATSTASRRRQPAAGQAAHHRRRPRSSPSRSTAAPTTTSRSAASPRRSTTRSSPCRRSPRPR
jgi:hypothetical protein